MRDAFRRRLPPRIVRAVAITARAPLAMRRSVELLRQHARRRCHGAPHTLLLHPFRPHMWDEYTVSVIACRLGIRLTSNIHARFSAAMHWHDTTKRARSGFLQNVSETVHVINLHGNDISKTRVDAVMKDVFGYALGVDPTNTCGSIVDKSDLNGLHDGQIVTGPVREPGRDRVYQRLIHGRRIGNVVEELRIPIMGDHIPFIHLKYKPIADPLTLSIHGTVAEPSSVLSQAEIETLIRFSHVLGIDFGELDCMRDQTDGLIYVFDVNNTPCVRFVGVSMADRRKTISRLAESFEAAFLSRSVLL